MRTIEETVYYYGAKEMFVSVVGSSSLITPSVYGSDSKTLLATLDKYIWKTNDEAALSSEVENYADLSSTYAVTLFNQYILPMIDGAYILRTSSEDPTASNAEAVSMMARVYAWFCNTFTYYKSVISAFETAQSDLMGQISNVTTTKFNDMPQTQAISTDDHLSTITSAEFATDGTSKADRLQEIRDKIENSYAKWAEEFFRIFVFVE